MAHWFLSVAIHHWKHEDSFCCPLRRGLHVFLVAVHRTTRVD